MTVEKITHRNMCTGCGLCSYTCVTNSIEMIDDDEGFKRPSIDSSRCTNCKECVLRCPMNSKNGITNSVQRTVAAQLLNKSELMNSASGGAFVGIARTLINRGGVVVGCVDDVENGGYFKLIRTDEEISHLVGSKYYQCDLSQEIYEKINTEIRQKINVLFIGTPCQVDAIKRSVVSNEYLFLVDILCQGVPSKKVVQSYHDDLSRKSGKKIIEHFYRSKENQQIGKYVTKLVFDDGSKYYGEGETDLYNRSFQRKVFLREACYKCKYVGVNRISDITLGDFWGLKKFDLSLNDGVSLVLINTERAELIYSATSDQLHSNERVLEEAVPYNQPLRSCAKRSVLRSVSYRLLDKLGFSLTTRILCYRYYVKRMIGRK